MSSEGVKTDAHVSQGASTHCGLLGPDGGVLRTRDLRPLAHWMIISSTGDVFVMGGGTRRGL